MSALGERAYFHFSLSLGRLLRAGRYSRTVVVRGDGEVQVQKHRLVHAPLLVWMGGGLLRILDTGVQVLPQREWEAREGRLYRSLHGASVRVEGGTLHLPRLPGETLASLLEDPAMAEPARREAIRLAVAALAEMHARGLTHGDAMAENVMIDLAAGVARWFDFETVHDPDRTLAWRRADDVRALLATALLRTAPERLAETLDLIIDHYADPEVTRLVGARFSPVLQRPLTLYLGQAPLSFRAFTEIAHLLSERSHASGSHP